MKKLEYKVINTLGSGVPLSGGGAYFEQFENALNELGQQGWQLAAVVSTSILIFIREIHVPGQDDSGFASAVRP